jgi:hypothetical protein
LKLEIKQVHIDFNELQKFTIVKWFNLLKVLFYLTTHYWLPFNYFIAVAINKIRINSLFIHCMENFSSYFLSNFSWDPSYNPWWLQGSKSQVLDSCCSVFASFLTPNIRSFVKKNHFTVKYHLTLLLFFLLIHLITYIIDLIARLVSWVAHALLYNRKSIILVFHASYRFDSLSVRSIPRNHT